MVTNKIIRAVGYGDEKAFDKIYFQFATSLTMFVDGYLQNIEDSKDVVQELFMKLPKMIKDNYDFSMKNFKTWLYQCAKNAAYNYKKKYYKARVEKFNEETYSLEAKPVVNAFRIFDLKYILTKEEYQVICLKFLVRLKIIDISKIMAISESSVKRIVKAAYQKIKIHCHEQLLRP